MRIVQTPQPDSRSDALTVPAGRASTPDVLRVILCPATDPTPKVTVFGEVSFWAGLDKGVATGTRSVVDADRTVAFTLRIKALATMALSISV